MQCPFCQAQDTKVIDSRLGYDGQQVRRRRECIKCEKRFTTYEIVELSLPRLIKKDGNYEQFSIIKLRNGILKSLEKRAINTDSIEKSIQAIIDNAMAVGEREISTNLLGEWVMQQLKQLDEVAYIRFASVYRQFKDINAFKEEITKLTTNTGSTV